MIQVVCTCKESAAIGCTAYTQVVLLTQTGVIDLVLPVVGSDIVLLAISTNYDATKLCIRIQLAVHTNQVLTLGLSVHVIAQTKLGTFNQVLVSPLPCRSLIHAQTISCTLSGTSHSVVLKFLEVSLVVSSRIGDTGIVLTTLHVSTPLGIEGNSCLLALLGRLGGYHDHTVTATCTIQSRRSSVLLNYDALDVLGVDVVQ